MLQQIIYGLIASIILITADRAYSGSSDCFVNALSGIATEMEAQAEPSMPPGITGVREPSSPAPVTTVLQAPNTPIPTVAEAFRIAIEPETRLADGRMTSFGRRGPNHGDFAVDPVFRTPDGRLTSLDYSDARPRYVALAHAIQQRAQELGLSCTITEVSEAHSGEIRAVIRNSDGQVLFDQNIMAFQGISYRPNDFNWVQGQALARILRMDFYNLHIPYAFDNLPQLRTTGLSERVRRFQELLSRGENRRTGAQLVEAAPEADTIPAAVRESAARLYDAGNNSQHWAEFIGEIATRSIDRTSAVLARAEQELVSLQRLLASSETGTTERATLVARISRLEASIAQRRELLRRRLPDPQSFVLEIMYMARASDPGGRAVVPRNTDELNDGAFTFEALQRNIIARLVERGVVNPRFVDSYISHQSDPHGAFPHMLQFMYWQRQEALGRLPSGSLQRVLSYVAENNNHQAQSEYIWGQLHDGPLRSGIGTQASTLNQALRVSGVVDLNAIAGMRADHSP